MHHFPAGVNSLDTRRPPPPPRRPRSSGLVFPERRVWAGCLPGAASLILAGILRSENYHPPAKTGRQGSGGAHTAACPGEAPASASPRPPEAPGAAPVHPSPAVPKPPLTSSVSNAPAHDAARQLPASKYSRGACSLCGVRCGSSRQLSY